MSNGLHVNHPLFLSDFKGTSILQTVFLNSNIKFHENPSSGSRVVQCGPTDGHTEGRTNVWTDDEADSHYFLNFANVPEKILVIS